MASKKPTLSNDEIQALADKAVRWWEAGELVHHVDSLGGVWSFEPVRDQDSRMEFGRTVFDASDDNGGRTVANSISARELGAEEARSILASRILACASPA